MARSEAQRRAVVELQKNKNCRILYLVDGDRSLITDERRSRPWIEKAIGIDKVHSVVEIRIPAEELDAAMPHLRRLPALSIVHVFPINRRDLNAEQKLREAAEKLNRALPRVEVEDIYLR
jgi:hypothetical protein